MKNYFLKKLYSILIQFLLVFTFSIKSYSQITSLTISTTGAGTWIAPCGVTNATIICIGAGGGGGGGNGSNKDAGGGGGGGGCAIYNTIVIVEGTSYNYTVGLGGTAGASGSNGVTGGFSQMIIGGITIKGFGGILGVKALNGAGGNGGIASGGTSNFSGGKGANGLNPNSGGGGEAASSTTIGINAIGISGGNGNPGADGGAGKSSNNGSGTAGSAPGGGGAGGNGTGTGAAGGKGQIIIMYNTPPTSIAGPNQTINCSGTTATLAGNTAVGYTGAWTTFTGSGSATTPTSATSDITGLTVGASTTFQWILTPTSGCSLAGDQVVIASTAACPPSNDEPINAIPLTIGAICNYSNFTNANATSSMCGTIPNPGCSSYTGGDVWYSATVPANGGFIIDSQTGIITDGGLAVYSGTPCGIMTLIGCDDDSSPNGSMPMLTVSGQVPGATVYIRFWEYSNDNNGTFSLCLTNLPATPANDNPCSATVAPVNTTASCTVQTGGTLAGATASGNALGSCFGTADDDVWYSFIANNSTQNISLNNLAGSTTDLYFSVYSGACGSLGAALICSDPETNSITGLTSGNTYFIRIYSYTSTNGQTSTFSLCISPPPPTPTNDNPCSAIPVTVNSAFSCTTETGGTVAGATASGNTLGSCYGTADDDVWFSFIANNTNQYINLNNLSGSTTDMYFSVYSGACSALGTALICSDPETGIVSGLTVGNTYIIRIYSYTSTIGQNSTFSICITPPPIQPANDNPCGATLASVNSAAGTCTTQTAGTIAGATASGNTLGACFGTADDDVWYSFIANSTSMNINLNNVTGSTTDLYHSVFAGVCGTLGAALICSDPNSSTINSLTIGATYFIRIYSYTNSTGQTTTFSLCINPTPPPPLNVTCNQMQPICSGSPIVFQAQSTGGSAAVGPNYGCLYSTPNPTWFFIEILTSGTMDIDLNAASDVDFALWGPYANLSAAQADCGTYPNPLDCSYSSSNVEQMNIASVVTGQVYAVLVTNYANVIQSITLNQANGASATTNCAILLPIDLLYFDVTLNQDVVNINWATESEINIHHFEIEKSIKGDKWETISYINGMGNSQVKTNYKSIDKQPYQNLSYYRLKQINIDETYNYSNIAAIDISKGKDQITDIHPNPTSDKIEFEILSKNKNTIIVEVINNIGTIISSQQNNIDEGNNLINLNLEKFDSGMYLIKISFENSEKILLQKIIKH